MSLAGSARRLAKRAAGPLVRALRGETGPLPPACWGLEQTADGRLAHQGLPLETLRERYGSPLHVVLGDRLVANARAYVGEGRPGPRPEVYASYKTNPVPGVLRVLHREGLGAEVISAYELWLAFRLGVPADRIVYNGPVKSLASVREAIEAGVLLNVNHREEIAVVAAAARALGRRPRVGVRVVTSAGWGGQFGVPVAGGEARRALEEARDSGVLDVCALHSHVGGMLRTREHALAHVGEVLALADEVRRELGLDVRILDLGGSLATPTVAPTTALQRRLNSAFEVELAPPDPAATLSIAAYVEVVMGAVTAHHAAAGTPLPRVFLEPGRSLTGDAQVLLASVHALKRVEGGRPWAILDAGINLAECLRGEYHQLFAAGRMGEPAVRTHALAGPICSPGDLLRASARLPALEPGDCLAIMDAGAYFVPFATSFSYPQPAVVLSEGGEARLLRRAETFEDLVALDAPQ